MLNSISGKNYKAFEEFELNISPITVLLGANSCGKSSIINLFLLLSQTIDSIEDLKGPLRLNGHNVGLGESINIIRNKDVNNNIEFSFDIESKALAKMSQRILNAPVRNFSMLIQFYEHFSTSFKNKETKEQFEILKGRLDRDDVISKNSIPEILKVVKLLKDEPNIKDIELFNFEHDDFIDVVKELNKISFTSFTPKYISYSLCNNITNVHDINFTIDEITLKNKKSQTIISINFNKKTSKSDIISDNLLPEISESLLSSINVNSLSLREYNGVNLEKKPRGFNFIDEIKKDINKKLSKIIESTIYLSVDELFKSLNSENITHITPLRAEPRRYYLLDKTANHKALNTMDGTSLAEVLKNTPSLVKKINNLIESFNLEISIDPTNEIIHQIIVHQDGLPLDITDVGFGISQFLPIIVQSLICPKGSIVLIEQPEIHLHPKMQTWLMDCLCEIALKEEKKIIIETHSDVMIKRLQLRMIDEDYDISREHVNIYNLERLQSKNEKIKTVMNRVEITDFSEIIWPNGFLDYEINDSIKFEELKFSLMKKASNRV
ncbi:AAA family ATPase [Vibrio parahaemolyticus]|uniref:AAA family ATPase n=1 Tax=Vibrio parahaemolyticus TaxID=670 RepID=UPI0030F33533